MVAELFPADDLAGMFQKDLEDFQRLLLQFDPDALPSQLRSLQVEFKNAELHKFRSGRRQRHPKTARGVSGTIWAAPARTVRKRRESLSGRRKRFEAM